MLRATDTGFAPWYVLRSDDKQRARLNVISDLLARIPYESMPRKSVTLPKQQKPQGYVEPDYPYRFMAEGF